MVIEHSFVSTLEQDELFAASAAYLAHQGFRPHRDLSLPLNVIELLRGVEKAHKAHSVVELPQRVRVEFDRGSVSIAALIEGSSKWGGGGMELYRGASSENPKKMDVHRRMMIAIVSGLENYVGHSGTGTAEYGDWLAVENEALELARKQKRRQRTTVIVLLTIIALIILVPILFAISR